MPTITRENKSVEKQVLDLENRYWKALQDGDTEACLEMTDDPCLVAGAKGVSRIDHDAFRKMMNTARHSLDDFEMKKTEFRQIGDDVAVLAYEVHEELSVDGEKVPIDASETSVWQKKGGKWLCVAHTESLRGDPLGRDRTEVSPG